MDNFLKMYKKNFLKYSIFIVILIGVIYFLFFGKELYLEYQNKLYVYMQINPILSPIFFIIIYIIASLFLITTLPLNIAAGFLWGPYLGSLYTLIAVVIGASISFILSRYICKEFVKKMLKNNKNKLKFISFNDSFSWKFVAFTRINPIFPTNLMNYFFGVTTINFKIYILNTIIFITPVIIFFSFVGYTFGSVNLNSDSKRLIENVLGISGSITLITIFIYVLKKRINLKKNN